MKILSIETSCDETAVSVVQADGLFPHATYRILGNALFSQIDIHREYGGVFPALAKREHAKTLVPMMTRALQEAKLLEAHANEPETFNTETLYEILHREPGLGDSCLTFFNEHTIPKIDLIAVTTGPGLEPALWVGINFARALAYAWNIPVIPINHMEGHILSSLFTGSIIPEIVFPAVALLISGGHTELILLRDWTTREKIGETRDDAVGEAFDKVARMLELPYPGGPEISTLAKYAREKNVPVFTELPRPMLSSNDFDFSFSGLKTAVRYAIQDKKLTDDEKASIAREFEDSVTTVLFQKTKKAIEHYNARTVIVGGGVSANTFIRESFTTFLQEQYPMLTLYLPPRNFSTDNSVMIALAGHARMEHAVPYAEALHIRADGNWSITEID